MIYTTTRFKKQYSRLSDELKSNIVDITNELNSLPIENQRDYLISLCGENGNAKWSGISSKTLYHFYPMGKQNTHRVFFCFATDLDKDLQEMAQLSEGIVFIDYVTRKEDEVRAAKTYEKNGIKYLSSFQPPIVEQKKYGYDNIPYFWFCLTKDQKTVLSLPQPSLVKGSAGTGKTILSFELLKQWIQYDQSKKYLYLTYTKHLLKRAIDSLTEDGIYLDSAYVHVNDFLNLVHNAKNKTIINESQARNIIKNILDNLERMNQLPINALFSDYFVFAYIRGLMKGRFNISKTYTLDYHESQKYLSQLFQNSNLSNSDNQKIVKKIIQHLEKDSITENDLNKVLIIEIRNITKNKKEKDKIQHIVNKLIDQKVMTQLNAFRLPLIKYDFISDEEIRKELLKNHINTDHIELLIQIKNSYVTELDNQNLIDDNDYAKFILNTKDLYTEAFDGVIVDEVQDLTEIQVEAIVKLTKQDSLNISFFGDPNQTINPTIYHYGRFNSYVFKEKHHIHLKNLKITHRCGPNLLEFINHLTSLRSILKLSTEREDLEPEVSANPHKIDTFWACLTEDIDLIKQVFDYFTRSEDCYLIVDNENTKEMVKKIISLEIGFDDEEFLDDQIITVQNAKGLECKNVILYNLISDNLSIFKNLETLNTNISAMTFNKLYVSTTRAEDSIIICETQIKNEVELKNMLFYENDKKLIEDLEEDEIGQYLAISVDPEVFIRQANQLLEDKNYIKANKKNNIAIKNIINQFDKHENFSYVYTQFQENELYKALDNFTNRFDTNGIEAYRMKFLEYIESLKINQTDDKNLRDYILFLRDIHQNLDEAIKIRKICEKRFEFDEYKTLLSDSEKIIFFEDFSLLDNYDCVIEVAKTLERELSEDYVMIAKYIFGYETYQKVKKLLSKIEFQNPEMYKLILDKNVIPDGKIEIGQKIRELRGLINE